MDIIERAREIRKQIESLSNYLTDEEAVESTELFPAWNETGSYVTGDRVRHNGTLYKVLQSHTAQADWAPEAAPSLFAEVLAGQDGTAIGEWVQPDSTNPYNTGDKVTYNGKTYESTIDGNVWSPEAYPQGWKEVTE